MAGQIETETQKNLPETSPHALHHIYSSLHEKKLLVVETEQTSHRIDEEAHGLQKMNVTCSESAFFLNNQQVSLKKFMDRHTFDFLVVNPYAHILPEIQKIIDAKKRVILITSSQSVDETCIAAIQKWQEAGIPTVTKDDLDQLPQMLMQTMDAMMTNKPLSIGSAAEAGSTLPV